MCHEAGCWQPYTRDIGGFTRSLGVEGHTQPFTHYLFGRLMAADITVESCVLNSSGRACVGGRR